MDIAVLAAMAARQLATRALVPASEHVAVRVASVGTRRTIVLQDARVLMASVHPKVASLSLRWESAARTTVTRPVLGAHLALVVVRVAFVAAGSTIVRLRIATRSMALAHRVARA